MVAERVIQIIKVSIRAPAWGATVVGKSACVDKAFQFALPRGERPSLANPPASIKRFNSRSRVGSDGLDDAIDTLLGVSIRAPAWGATTLHLPTNPKPKVSIRAPAWGETVRGFGGRFWLVVSIRAPAWGATWLLALVQARQGGFNSRSRVGSDRRQD